MRTNHVGRLPGIVSITIALALLVAFTGTASAQSSADDFFDQWILIHGRPHILDDVRAYPEQQRQAEFEDYIDRLRRQQRRHDLANQWQHFWLMNELRRQERNRRLDQFMQSQAGAFLPAPKAGTARPSYAAPAAPRQATQQGTKYETLEQFTARLKATKAQEKPRVCPFWKGSCWK